MKQIIKNFFWYFVAGIISVIVYANLNKCSAQVRKGNTFIASSTTAKSDTIITEYKYEIKGKQYPIILSKKSAYIGRISKNGNYYRYYLPKEINATIHKELNKDTNN